MTKQNRCPFDINADEPVDVGPVSIRIEKTGEQIDLQKAENDLFAWLGSEYPMGIRRLPDGSIAAMYKLLYTTGLVLGVDRYGYSRRFCFACPVLALEAFEALVSEDDVPQGWIARR